MEKIVLKQFPESAPNRTYYIYLLFCTSYIFFYCISSFVFWLFFVYANESIGTSTCMYNTRISPRGKLIPLSLQPFLSEFRVCRGTHDDNGRAGVDFSFLLFCEIKRWQVDLGLRGLHLEKETYKTFKRYSKVLWKGRSRGWGKRIKWTMITVLKSAPVDISIKFVIIIF